MDPTIRIQFEPFDVAGEIERLSHNTGAVATFTGHVRGENGLTSLSLEHYPGMTEREISRHVAEAAKRWPLLGITVIHRVGELSPGEAIVLVVVAALHRGEAFAACEFVMDHLKTTAPFWKLEKKGAAAQWIDAKSSDDTAVERWTK
jgi:molybdopterin synthase catalytic subunit